MEASGRITLDWRSSGKYRVGRVWAQQVRVFLVN